MRFQMFEDIINEPESTNYMPEFNIRQVNYLFVKAVESKFNEELKPQYVKEMEDYNPAGLANLVRIQENNGTTTLEGLKGFKKSESVLN